MPQTEEQDLSAPPPHLLQLFQDTQDQCVPLQLLLQLCELSNSNIQISLDLK